MSSRHSPRGLAALVVAVALVGSVAAPPAAATDYTWQGWTDNLWSTSGNWDPAGVPGMADKAIFDAWGLAQPTVDLSGGFRFAQTVSLRNDASTYTLSGGTLMVNGLIEQTDTSGLQSNEITSTIADPGTGIAIDVAGGTLMLSGQVGSSGSPVTLLPAGVIATGATLAITNDSAATPNNIAGSITVQGTLQGRNGSLGGTTILLDGGTADLSGRAGLYLPGLLAGRAAGAFNENGEPAAWSVAADLQQMGGHYTDPYTGQPNGPDGQPLWTNNLTWVYRGQFLEDDGTVSFAKNFDDSVLLLVDGAQWIRSTSYTTPTTSGAKVITPGWHDFEVRFGQGGGGVGAVNQGGQDFLAAGFALGYDTQGRGNVTVGEQAQIPAANFRYLEMSGSADFGNDVVVTGNSAINATGEVNLGGLTLHGGSALNFPAGPAANNAVTFTSTTIDDTTVGNVTLNNEVNVTGGPFMAGTSNDTFTKDEDGSATFTTLTAPSAAMTLNVNGGKLTYTGQVQDGFGWPVALTGTVNGGSLEFANTDGLNPNQITGSVAVNFGAELVATGDDTGASALDQADVTLSNSTLRLKSSAGSSSTEGLLAYWGFNEGAGTTAGDGSGSVDNRDLTLQPGAAWEANGRSGSALSLNNSATAYAEDADGEAYINGLDSFTLTMWIKSDLTGTDRGFFIAHEPTGQDRFFTARYDAAGASSGGTPNVIKTGISTTTDDESQVETETNTQTLDWQHVAVTWTSTDAGGDGLLHVYLDGTESGYASGREVTAGVLTDCTTVIVGRGGKDQTTTSWDGLIDETYIYDHALTEAQIQSLMDAPGPGVGGTVTMAGTVTVSGNSTIDVVASATVGGMDLADGTTLQVTGMGSLAAADTTFHGGTVAIDNTVDTALGALNDGGMGLTVTKTGAGGLVLDETAVAGSGAATTFAPDVGPLVIVSTNGGLDPLAGASVQMNATTGSVLFASKAGDVTVPTNFDVNEDVTFVASTYASGAATGADVQLAGPIDVAAGKTLSLATADGYTFTVNTPVTGGGNLNVAGGTADVDGSIANLLNIGIGAAGRLNANNANALGAANNVAIAGGGFLDIQAAQNAFPATIDVAAGAALGGNLQGVNWAAGGNAVLHTDAILVLDLASAYHPTYANVGCGYWLGITNMAGTYNGLGCNGVGDSGGDGPLWDGVYQGVVISDAWSSAGDFTGTLAETTDGAPTGFAVRLERDVALRGATVNAQAGHVVAFTDEGRLDLYGNSFTAGTTADTFERIGIAPTADDPGTTGRYVLYLNQPDSIPGGPTPPAQTWTVQNGIVRQTDDGVRQAIGDGAVVNIGQHATYFTSQGRHGTGTVNVMDGGMIRLGGTGRAVPPGTGGTPGGVTFEDGAAIALNYNDINWDTELLPKDTSLDLLVNNNGNFPTGLYLGQDARLTTHAAASPTITGGTVGIVANPAGPAVTDASIQVPAGQRITLGTPVNLGGVDLTVGADAPQWTTAGPGGQPEDLARLLVDMTGELHVNQLFRAASLTMPSGNVIFNGDDVNVTGDIVVDGPVLYLGGGGTSNNAGNLTGRLIADPAAGVAARVADRIVIGDNGRLEMGIQFDAPRDPTTNRVHVTQPFVIAGDVRPADKRSIWVSRMGGTDPLPVDLRDVTLASGGVFTVDEANTEVIAHLKVAGDSTVTQFDAIGYAEIVRDASLPAFDPGLGNFVNLNWGRAGDTAMDAASLQGPIGPGVAINIENAMLDLQGLGADGTVGVFSPNTLIRLNGHDLKVRVDESATGIIVNQMDATVYVPAIGGRILHQQNLDVGASDNGYVYLPNVVMADGAHLRLNKEANNPQAIYDIELEGDASVVSEDTGTIWIGDVSGSGGTLTWVHAAADNNTRTWHLVGRLDNANVTLDHAGAQGLSRWQLMAQAVGPYSSSFDLNGNTLNLVSGEYVEVMVDPGAGTINSTTAAGPELRIHAGQDGAAGLTGALTINLAQGNILRGWATEVAAGLPQIVNRIDALVNVPDTAQIDADRVNDAALDGFTYFTDVRLASGAVLNLDRVSGSTVVNLTIADNASVSNIGNGTTIFVADVAATEPDGVLNVGGGADLNLVGTLGADVDVTNAGTTYLLDMTTTSLGKAFDLGGHTVNVQAGVVQLGGTKPGWGSMGPPNANLDPGAGTINQTDGEVTIRTGQDGSFGAPGWGGGVTVNKNADTATTLYVDEVAPGETAVENRFNGQVNLATAGTLASDRNVDADRPGTAFFANVHLADGVAVDLVSNNNQYLKTNLTLDGATATATNDSSNSRIRIADVAGVGDLTLAGANRTQLVGQVGAGTNVIVTGRAAIEDGFSLAGTARIAGGGDLEVNIAIAGDGITIQTDGLLMINDAGFTPGGLVQQDASIIGLGVDMDMDDANPNGRARRYIGIAGYDGTLTLNNNDTEIGATRTDWASIVQPTAGNALVGSATQINLAGGNTLLSVGDGVLRDLGGATSLTISRNVRLEGAASHTGTTAIWGGRTVAMATDSLSGGAVTIGDWGELQVMADGFDSGLITVHGTAAVPPDPARLGVLDIHGATLNSDVMFSGGRIESAGDATVAGALTEDDNMSFQSGSTLTFAQGVALAGARTWDVAAGTVAFQGDVTGAALTKTGAGVLRLEGTGGVVSSLAVGEAGVSGGGLAVLGNGAAVPTAVVINAESAYGVETPGHTYGEVNLTSSSGALALGADTGAALTFANDQLTLGASSPATYSGTLVPSNYVYRLGGGGSTLTLAGGVLVDYDDGGGALATDARIGRPDPATDITDAGMVVLGPSNTLTGEINVDMAAGITDGSSIDTAAMVYVNPGGSLDLGTYVVPDPYVGAGHNIVLQGGGVSRNGGTLTANDLAYLYQMSFDTSYVVGGGGGAAANTDIVDGALGDGLKQNLYKIGTSTVTLLAPADPNNPENYYGTGGKTEVQGGVLVLQNVSSIGLSEQVSVVNDGTLKIETTGDLGNVQVDLNETGTLHLDSGVTLTANGLAIGWTPTDLVVIPPVGRANANATVTLAGGGTLDLGATTVGGTDGAVLTIADNSVLIGRHSAAGTMVNNGLRILEGSSVRFRSADAGNNAGIGSMLPNSTLTFADDGGAGFATTVYAHYGLVFDVDPSAGPAGWSDGVTRTYDVTVGAGGNVTLDHSGVDGALATASYTDDTGLLQEPVAHVRKLGAGALTVAREGFNLGSGDARKLDWTVEAGTLQATGPGAQNGLGVTALAWLENDRTPVIASQHLERIEMKSGTTLGWGGVQGFLPASLYGGLPAGQGDGFNPGEFKMHNNGVDTTTLNGSNLELGFALACTEPGTGTPFGELYHCYPTLVGTGGAFNLTLTGSTNFNSGIATDNVGSLDVTVTGGGNAGFTNLVPGAVGVDVIDNLTVADGRARIYQTHNGTVTTQVDAAGTLEFSPGAGNSITYAGSVQVDGAVQASSGTTDLGTTVMMSAAPAPVITLGVLQAGRAAGAFNEGGEPAAWSPAPDLSQMGLALTDPYTGQPNGPDGQPLWTNDLTWVYRGQFKEDDGVVSFAENFDDNVLLLIDGQQWIRNTGWDVPTTTGTKLLTPGWHDFEVRFGQGGGGAGAVNGGGQDYITAGFALGYDTQGRGNVTVGEQMQIPSANFRSASGGDTGIATVDAGAVLKVAGFQGFNEVNVNGQLITGETTSVTRALNVGAAGQLDLTTGNLVVDYEAWGETPLQQITDMLTNGQNINFGYWDGAGIVSSAAANDPTGLTTLGVMDNAEYGWPDLEGTPVALESVLVKYTYYGDADLDGSTTGDDYFLWLAGFDAAREALAQGTEPTLSGWLYGDFDYSGDVTGDDYFLWLVAFDAARAGATPLGGNGGVSAIPEPATLSLLGLGVLAALARRRRSR